MKSHPFSHQSINELTQIFISRSSRKKMVSGANARREFREQCSFETHSNNRYDLSTFSTLLNQDKKMKKSDANQDQPASETISKRIAELGDWRGETLGRMRKLIKEADPDVIEE